MWLLYRVVPKKGNPHLAVIFKYFMEVIILSVYIFVKCRYFYVTLVVKKSWKRMSMLRLVDEMSPCPYGFGLTDCNQHKTSTLLTRGRVTNEAIT